MFGIPINIQPFFWLLAALIGWLSSMSLIGTVVWMTVILFSVLIHEFGHALTATAFGQQAAISLTGFGGMTYRSGKQLPLWKEFLIVLNGPVAGFLLCAAAYFASGAMGEREGLVAGTLQITWIVNLFWTVVNLLPVQPLDGGRLLSIVLEGALGFRGVKVAQFLSLILCGLIGLAFFAIGWILPGALFFILTFENYRGFAASRTMSDKDRDQGLWQQLKEAEFMMREGRNDEAFSRLEELIRLTKRGVLHKAAVQYQAEICARAGKFNEAYALLHPLKKELAVEGQTLLHQTAYKAGHYREALDVGVGIFRENPNKESALINAFCAGRLGRSQEAVGWLQSAQNQGSKNIIQMVQREDFDAVRRDEPFASFAASVH